jgi:putative N6-adenine-specific DNA methylase
MIYKSNYYLRTALRILREIESFTFRDIDQFYLKCKNINWESFISLDESFVISSTVNDSNEFKNSMFASLRVKDAIADRFREKTGKRPNVDTEDPDLTLNVHIWQNNCTLSIDSSGESLHKRGYRIKQGDAPLNEVLAAGMILLTGWDGSTDFIDPMCGSGTLSIEAAMVAQNIPAGRFRKGYAFEKWKEYKSELWEKVVSESEKKPFTKKIYASDISSGNLLNAQTNARRALVFNKITFTTSSLKDLSVETENATIIINPPYGERLKHENLDELYSMIGDKLKHGFPGNTAWILSSATENFKFIGLKPSKKYELYNGPLKCGYNGYQLFSGSLADTKKGKTKPE